MRAVVQRVSHANVQVGDELVSSIGVGFMILLGVGQEDGEREAHYLAHKIAGLRLFEDKVGKMNLALEDVGGAALVVSQFTLFGDARKGRRPSFSHAASLEAAELLYQRFCTLLAGEGIVVAKGIFQAHMQVTLTNDGPVTLWLDTATMM
jgi:D-tyrosyl-tRNA(Tyr) deacylase